ncbi:sensor histidine kinase, partial [Dorea longicatena]|uniref:sensor histidine kinase n=2 Tax=Lachnospiraceae TaxID=186803 RepID=UPI001FADEEE1
KLDFGLLSELVIEELQTKAQEKNIEITLQKQDDLFMNGDQTLILRMMINLITNAINYGKINGHIHVILKVENDQIVGEVKDDGIGISEEHLDRIWERFYRIDKSRSRENGGTGLGLSMVRWIVNLHNGTIHVESIEGIGTSFIFRFPKI